MRFNEHELIHLATKCKPALEARFWHRPPQGMIRQEGFRERLVRLKCNFLFYIRTNEQGQCLEPLGALCLERCVINKEPRSDKGYAFSISYPGDTDRKHYFISSSAQLCEHWMSELKSANFERLATTFSLLQTKLVRLKKQPIGRSPRLSRRSQLIQDSTSMATAPSIDQHQTNSQTHLHPTNTAQSQARQQPPANLATKQQPPITNNTTTDPQSSGNDGLLIDFS